MRDDRYLERQRQRFNRGATLRQSYCEHPSAPNGFDHASYLRNVGLVRKQIEVQTDGGSFEELRRRRSAPGELVEDRSRVGGANADLHQSHLTESDFDGLFAYDVGWLVHPQDRFIGARGD